VNDGRDVVGKVFRPDAPWMREHDVRSVVTWRQDPRGGPDIVDIQGVGEPRAGPPGPAEERGEPRP
jgi:hypothetical protein